MFLTRSDRTLEALEMIGAGSLLPWPALSYSSRKGCLFPISWTVGALDFCLAFLFRHGWIRLFGRCLFFDLVRTDAARATFSYAAFMPWRCSSSCTRFIWNSLIPFKSCKVEALTLISASRSNGWQGNGQIRRVHTSSMFMAGSIVVEISY